jgi:hypothetical protein
MNAVKTLAVIALGFVFGVVGAVASAEPTRGRFGSVPTGANDPAAGWTSNGTTTSSTQTVSINPGPLNVGAIGIHTDGGIRFYDPSGAMSGKASGAANAIIEFSGGVRSVNNTGFLSDSAGTTAFYATGASQSAASFWSDATSIGASMGSASGTCAYKARTAGARFCGSGANTYWSDDGTTITFAGPVKSAATETRGTITLAAGTGTATVLSGAICVCTDTTALQPVQCAVVTTTLTATGTTTDVIAYICL